MGKKKSINDSYDHLGCIQVLIISSADKLSRSLWNPHAGVLQWQNPFHSIFTCFSPATWTRMVKMNSDIAIIFIKVLSKTSMSKKNNIWAWWLHSIVVVVVKFFFSLFFFCSGVGINAFYNQAVSRSRRKERKFFVKISCQQEQCFVLFVSSFTLSPPFCFPVFITFYFDFCCPFFFLFSLQCYFSKATRIDQFCRLIMLSIILFHFLSFSFIWKISLLF